MLTEKIPADCEVCVIGSGAGGAPAAYALAKAGIKTVLLERGIWRFDPSNASPNPAWQHELDDDEVERDYRRKWFPGDKNYSLVHRHADKEYKRHKMGQGFGVVGGSTVFYAAAAWRMREADFQKQTIYGERLKKLIADGNLAPAELPDWPNGFYKKIEPFYCKAEELIGISGDDTHDPTRPARSKKSLLPPLPYHRFHEILDSGARRLGWAPFPIPLGMRSVARLPKSGWEMEACKSCGYCSGYPCVYKAKSSMDEALLLPAKRKYGDHLVVGTGATVRRINQDGKRCTSVTYVGRDGHDADLKCDVVVLAAGGILSTRLLLLSGIDKLAPNKDAIGKYLTVHVNQYRWASFPGDFEDRYLVNKKLAVMDKYYPSEGSGHVNHASIQTASKAGPIAFANRETAWGEPAVTRIADKYMRSFAVQAMVEDLPQKSNSIVLHDTDVDEFGDPRAKVTQKYHALDIRATDETLSHIEELILSSGGELMGDRPEDPNPSGTHLMGALRMGEDPKDSVVDENCRLHELENLFVTDCSIFPTSAGINPSLTIQANAFRVADHIRANVCKKP